MLSIIRKFFLLSHLAPFFYPPSPVNFLLLRFVKFPFCKFSILYFPLWIFSIAGVVEPRDEFSLIGRNRFACREKIYNLFHPATGLTRAFLLPSYLSNLFVSFHDSSPRSPLPSSSSPSFSRRPITASNVAPLN